MSRASVVITNPTHYAVALEFSLRRCRRPTVLAKGRDLHGREIREEARWAGVPMIENPPLARSLYRWSSRDNRIPFELYAAVAGNLAYLYRQKVEERMRRMHEQQREPNRPPRHGTGRRLRTFHDSGDAMSSSAVLAAPAAYQASHAKQDSTAKLGWAQWLGSMQRFAAAGRCDQHGLRHADPGAAARAGPAAGGFHDGLGASCFLPRCRCARRSTSPSSRRSCCC